MRVTVETPSDHTRKIMDEILLVLEASGVAVRWEILGDSPGGLCTVKGNMVLILNRSALPSELARTCARALVKAADIETLYLRPDIRRFVEEVDSTTES